VGNLNEKSQPTYLVDISRTAADVGVDENGRARLVIGDGNVSLEFSGGPDVNKNMAGARRIIDAIWNYLVAVKRHELHQRWSESS